MNSVIQAPHSEKELVQRATAIAGLSLGALAARLGLPIPANLLRDKGWIGQLLECALGSTAQCKPEPDFEALGIELKTIPINAQGKPVETTFVTSIDLLKIGSQLWENSTVRKKLARVLWVPIEADKSIALKDRRIGMAILWSPSAEIELALRQDWSELSDMIALGELEKISARHGVYLQVRPKAANAKALCWGFDAAGEKVLTLPRGFYLRTQFTGRVLESHYIL